MPLPRIAIVGRPNVGKSSLLNMIAGAKISIVDPTPGVTRDRVSAIVDLYSPLPGGEPKPCEFIDTGGFGVYVTEGNRFDEVGNDLAELTASIEFQIAQAVEGADLVLFAVDAQAGITPQDLEIARLLREGSYAKPAKQKKGPTPRTDGRRKQVHKARPPVRVVATKVDGPKWESHALELAGLGFGEPIAVSAKNNYFRRDFLEALYDLVPEAPKNIKERIPAELYVAIVGKRNAGKSTLVNTLAGEERVIASEIPGTTRDAVDVRMEIGGRTLVAIDTAGLRKKKSFQSMIDQYAFDRLERSVDRADVVMLLLDATEKISQVDEHLAMLAQKAFKPTIIVVNKWDATKGRKGRDGKAITPQSYEDYVRHELRGLWYAPIAFMSGATGLNVNAVLDLAFELKKQSGQRVTTGKLNRVVRAIFETRGPTDIKGRWAKVYYVAQTGVEPPTITLVVNYPELFTSGYLRFLMNRFREELPYSEVPMRIVVRARRQREDDLKEDGPTRIARGRKGVGVMESAEVGAELLSDEFSEAVNIDQFADDADADEYFKEYETRP